MKLSEHYVCLYQAIAQNKGQSSYQVSIQELTDILCCTKRHTKHLLKQLNEKGWVIWEAKPGRGKTSSLTFLLKQDELQLELAKELAAEEKYEKAFDTLRHMNAEAKMQYHQWLSTQLGISTEVTKQRELDVLRYPFYKCIQSLDPLQLISRHDVHIASQLFDTLLTYNAQEGQLQPHLAYNWEAQDDGKTWTFYLRKGIKFHHGRELTAKDVLYTLKRLKSTAQSNQEYKLYSFMKDIEIIRKFVIRINLHEANLLFPHYFTNHQTYILPYDGLENSLQGSHMKPIGTGPFKLVRHDDTMIALEAHDAYFLGRPQLDRVEIITLPELYPKQNEMINNWFNLGDRSQEENWQKVNRVEEGASYYTFNLNKQGIQQNTLFRKALYTALDIRHIGDDLIPGYFFPAYSFLVSESAKATEHSYNITEAKKLLQLAGYQGETIHIISTELRPGANHQDEALWLQTQWQQIGVNATVCVIHIEELAREEILEQADVIVAGIALTSNALLSLVKTFQVPTAFIANTVGSQLGQVVQDCIKEVITIDARQQQLSSLLQLENRLKSEYALNFLHHRTHSVFVNVGSSLAGIKINDCGRIDYKSLWFKV